jgi:hypothetical protein
MLAKAGTLCREELDTTLEAMKQLVEPVLVLTVGATVTIMVSAMYLPVFEIGAVAGAVCKTSYSRHRHISKQLYSLGQTRRFCVKPAEPLHSPL